MNLTERPLEQKLTRTATFADMMSDATVINDLSKAVTVVTERLNAQMDDVAERALASDYPAPTIQARRFAAFIQNVIVARALTSQGVSFGEIDVDAFAAKNGGVILTVDYREKRLTFRIDPSGGSASVSEIGGEGFEDRVQVEGAHGIVPLFSWLVRAS